MIHTMKIQQNPVNYDGTIPWMARITRCQMVARWCMKMVKHGSMLFAATDYDSCLMRNYEDNRVFIVARMPEKHEMRDCFEKVEGLCKQWLIGWPVKAD